MHDELRTGHPKVATDECVNTIRALLNEDHRLTLRKLETIMNDDNEEEVKTFTQNYFTNLGTQFYHLSIQNLVLRYDKCLNLFGNYVEKLCTQKE